MKLKSFREDNFSADHNSGVGEAELGQVGTPALPHSALSVTTGHTLFYLCPLVGRGQRCGQGKHLAHHPTDSSSLECLPCPLALILICRGRSRGKRGYSPVEIRKKGTGRGGLPYFSTRVLQYLF